MLAPGSCLGEYGQQRVYEHIQHSILIYKDNGHFLEHNEKPSSKTPVAIPVTTPVTPVTPVTSKMGCSKQSTDLIEQLSTC